ncbi:MAG: hypothetical protein JWM33_2400 [Caulobacteraceae bacterium]|nr:hypothetical protein [Caulobacteraceae bacterium]
MKWQRVAAVVVLCVAIGLCGLAWIFTPFRYPWEDDQVLAHQLDDNAVSSIEFFAVLSILFGLMSVWVRIESSSGAGWRRRWVFVGSAALVIAASIARFLIVQSLPNII